MPLTLKIDDEDAMDLLRDLESAFDIRISDAEAAACHRLGDIFDLLIRKFSESGIGGDACAGAMAFYRLRRAFAELVPGVRLRPSTPLTIVANMSPNRLFKDIGARAGLRLPYNDLSWRGCIGAAGLVIGLFTLVPLVAFFGWRILASAILVALPFLLLRQDPGRFPKDCADLGALATQVSRLNFGTLARAGARVTQPEIWNILTALTSPYTSVPAAEMRADATLLQSQRRAA